MPNPSDLVRKQPERAMAPRRPRGDPRRSRRNRDTSDTPDTPDIPVGTGSDPDLRSHREVHRPSTDPTDPTVLTA